MRKWRNGTVPLVDCDKVWIKQRPVESRRRMDSVQCALCALAIRRSFVQYFIERQGDVDAVLAAGIAAAWCRFKTAINKRETSSFLFKELFAIIYDDCKKYIVTLEVTIERTAAKTNKTC